MSAIYGYPPRINSPAVADLDTGFQPKQFDDKKRSCQATDKSQRCQHLSAIRGEHGVGSAQLLEQAVTGHAHDRRRFDGRLLSGLTPAGR